MHACAGTHGRCGKRALQCAQPLGSGVQAKGPLSALRTLGAMLAPRTREGFESDMAAGIVVQVRPAVDSRHTPEDCKQRSGSATPENFNVGSCGTCSVSECLPIVALSPWRPCQ